MARPLHVHGTETLSMQNPTLGLYISNPIEIFLCMLDTTRDSVGIHIAAFQLAFFI